ncbi:hypothetical protein QE177_10530 [Arsenophonus sp. aPb]|uniref:hypothetical protein n=1 Tax=Arsenophonus sp. aPb TaxID=3041619 RepID=UPI002468D1BC|nr:hypothetical protein [Arsenophonus sp. aPb]WGL97636.1 hypothetical protein QE177_10530 [Arsenophonus sp. aPb]
MSINGIKNPDVIFCQNKHIFEDFNQKIALLKKKYFRLDLTDKRFQIDEGICYGLSLMYMCQFAQGGYVQGDKFLESIKELNQLSNLAITHDMDDYDKIIIEAKKLHANAKINDLLNEAIYLHNFINKYALLYATKLVNLRQVINQNNKDIMEICRGGKHFTNRNDVNCFIDKFYAESINQNNELVQFKWHRDIYVEWQRICTVENILSIQDILLKFKQAKTNVINSYSKDIEFFLSNYNIGYDNITGIERYCLLEASSQTFADILDRFRANSDGIYLNIGLKAHSVMLTIENDNNHKPIFTLFDSNTGVYHFTDKQKLTEFFNQLASIYAVEKQADGNFTFAMGSFVKKSHLAHQQDHQKERQLNRFLVNDNEISTIALAKLIDKQNKIKIDERISLKFISIDEKTQTTKLEIINHKNKINKKIKLTIDCQSVDEIKHFIQQHKQDLDKYQGKRIYLNKSNGHYDVYRNSYEQNIAILQQKIIKGKKQPVKTI